MTVCENITPILGIASRISITCDFCNDRKYIDPMICKNKESIHEKGNQIGNFAINNVFILGCHEAGMSPVDADIICSSLCRVATRAGRENSIIWSNDLTKLKLM